MFRIDDDGFAVGLVLMGLVALGIYSFKLMLVLLVLLFVLVLGLIVVTVHKGVRPGTIPRAGANDSVRYTTRTKSPLHYVGWLLFG